MHQGLSCGQLASKKGFFAVVPPSPNLLALHQQPTAMAVLWLCEALQPGRTGWETRVVRGVQKWVLRNQGAALMSVWVGWFGP